jgi:hypothetical protein
VLGETNILDEILLSAATRELAASPHDQNALARALRAFLRAGRPQKVLREGLATSAPTEAIWLGMRIASGLPTGIGGQ